MLCCHRLYFCRKSKQKYTKPKILIIVYLNMKIQILTFVVSILFSLCIGLYAYFKKSISKSGLAALIFICGFFIYNQSYEALAILFAMFASSSVLSKYKHAQKIDMDKVVAKTGPRDAMQAFANLGSAVLCYSAYLWLGYEGLLFAFVGSIAASNADSWASEIGGLSTKTPVMITNLKPITKGISGGVTLLGTSGGVLGSFFISTLGYLLMPINNSLTLLWIAFISGIIGFMLDSLLGALIQAQYIDANNGATERSENGTLVKGFSWIDNDMVNLICSFISGCTSLFLFLIIQ